MPQALTITLATWIFTPVAPTHTGTLTPVTLVQEFLPTAYSSFRLDDFAGAGPHSQPGRAGSWPLCPGKVKTPNP